MKKFFPSTSNLLNYKYSIVWVLIIELVFVFVGYYFGDRFQVFDLSRQQSQELLKETLSNNISLLGIGLAILAILLSVIQMTNKRLTIVKLVLENTFFAPLFIYGSANILLCSFLFLYGNDLNFVTDAMFVRGVVILKYQFVILIIFLITVFLLFFKYIDYSNITDLYLNNTKELAKTEIFKTNDESFREVLQVKGNELRNEIEASIEENKVTVIDKIFDLYLFVFKLNPSSVILQYLRSYIRTWIFKSYKERNYIVCNNLVRNWFSLYRDSINSKDINKIIQTQFLPSESYQFAINNNEDSLKLMVVDYFPIRLKETAQINIWSHDLKAESHLEKNLLDIEEKNSPILVEFNELIHIVSLHSDENLVEVLNQFRMLEEISDFNFNYKNLAFKIKYATLFSSSNETVSESDKLKFNFVNKFLLETFAIKFGNLSWLYYSIFTGRKTYRDLEGAIKQLESTLQIDRSDFVRNVINILKSEKSRYRWSEWIWQSEKRLSGKVYTLENEESFLSLGFIVWVLKNNVSTSNIEQLTSEELESSNSLVHFSKEVLKFYKGSRQRWTELLNIEDDSELDRMFENGESLIGSLSEAKESTYLKELVKEPLSNAKVELFKKSIGDQWRKSKTIDDLFTYYNSIELNPNKNLKFIGHGRINFHKAKFLFVDKLYQNIYGLDWGHEVCEQVNDYLITSMFSNSERIIEIKNLSEALEKAASYEYEQQKLNIALVSYRNWYQIERDLSSSGKFSSFTKEERKTYPFDVLGTYNNTLLVVPIRTSIIMDFLVAFNISSGLILQRRTNEEWVDSKLQIDVIEIDDNEADKILQKNGFNVPYAEKDIIETKAGIIIEIGETLDFLVKNESLIKVFKQKIV